MIALPALPVGAELPPLIPRDVLFGNPDKAGPQISPDGKHLAYLAPDDKNVLQVWVRPIDKAEAKKITSDEKRGIRQYFWAHDGKHLLYLQDMGGDENFHLFAVRTRDGQDPRPDAVPRRPRAGRRPRREAPGHDPRRAEQARTRPCSTCTASPSRPARRSSTPRTPARSSAGRPTRTSSIRAATAMNPKTGGYDLMVREKPGAEWKMIKQWTNEEQGRPPASGTTPNTLYVIGNDNANTMRLIEARPRDRQGRGDRRGQGIRRRRGDDRRQEAHPAGGVVHARPGPSGRCSTTS